MSRLWYFSQPLKRLDNGPVMSYGELLDKFWKDEENAIYSRVSYHFSKIRSTILKTIGKSKRNKEKVKNIFKVISRRGIMLNLEEDKVKINWFFSFFYSFKVNFASFFEKIKNIFQIKIQITIVLSGFFLFFLILNEVNKK